MAKPKRYKTDLDAYGRQPSSAEIAESTNSNLPKAKLPGKLKSTNPTMNNRNEWPRPSCCAYGGGGDGIPIESPHGSWNCYQYQNTAQCGYDDNCNECGQMIDTGGQLFQQSCSPNNFCGGGSSGNSLPCERADNWYSQCCECHDMMGPGGTYEFGSGAAMCEQQYGPDWTCGNQPWGGQRWGVYCGSCMEIKGTHGVWIDTQETNTMGRDGRRGGTIGRRKLRQGRTINKINPVRGSRQVQKMNTNQLMEPGESCFETGCGGASFCGMPAMCVAGPGSLMTSCVHMPMCQNNAGNYSVSTCIDTDNSDALSFNFFPDGPMNLGFGTVLGYWSGPMEQCDSEHEEMVGSNIHVQQMIDQCQHADNTYNMLQYECKHDTWPDLGDYDTRCWCRTGEYDDNVGDCDGNSSGFLWFTLPDLLGVGHDNEASYGQCKNWCKNKCIPWAENTWAENNQQTDTGGRDGRRGGTIRRIVRK